MFFAFATSGDDLKKPELKSYIDAKMATTQQKPDIFQKLLPNKTQLF